MTAWARVFLLALIAGSLGHGAIITSTFSSTPPGYLTGFAYGISLSGGIFPIPSLHSDWAMQFVVPAGMSFRFTGYQVPIEIGSGTTAATTVNFTLALDAGGLPGAALETISTPVLSTVPSVLTGTSLLQPVLAGGTAYWLVAAISTSFPNTSAGWNAPSPLLPGATPTGLVGNRTALLNTWSVSPGVEAAYEIDGAPIASTVPETSSATLVVIGWLALAACFQVRARQAS